MGVSFHHQYWVKNRSYDFKINNLKLLIEVNGDYWHANPSLYKASDILSYQTGKKTAQEIWDKDQKKKEIAESYGYKVIYFWENDIKSMTNDELEDQIWLMMENCCASSKT